MPYLRPPPHDPFQSMVGLRTLPDDTSAPNKRSGFTRFVMIFGEGSHEIHSGSRTECEGPT